MVGVLAGLFPVAAALVQVDGTSCPPAAEVEGHLRALLPAAAQERQRLAVLTRDPTAPLLHVELRDGEGQVLTRRSLSTLAPCADLAAAAAVVLAAAWDAPLPSAVPPTIRLAASPTPPPPQGIGWEIAAAAFAAFAGRSGDEGGAGTGVAAAGSLELFIAPPGGRLGARVAFLGAGTRDEPLGAGYAAWTRLAVAAGPRFILQRGRLVTSLHADALIAAVLVRGVGFPTPYSSADVDFGLGGGARVGWRLGRFIPFVGGALCGWLRPQELRVEGLAATATLPRFELLLGGGVAFGPSVAPVVKGFAGARHKDQEP